MKKVNGIAILVEVQGLEQYAKCVLHFTNIKSSRTSFLDVKTLEGTDRIVITGHKQYGGQLKSIAESYGEVLNVTDKTVLIIEDEDIEQVPEVSKELNRLFDADEIEDTYIVGKFEN